MFRNCFDLKTFLSKADIRSIRCSRFNGQYNLSSMDWKAEIKLSQSKPTEVVFFQQGNAESCVYQIQSAGALQLQSFLDLKISQIMC
jgi:hypothetical protein